MSPRQKTHPALRPSPYADAPEGLTRRREQKYFSGYRKSRASVPNLVEFQLTSFTWLCGEGLRELFKEFSPIVDYSGKKFELSFTGFDLGDPKYDEFSAKEHMATFDAPLRARVLLVNKALQTEKEQEIFLTDFPLQTSHGTFIINGIERVIVPQLARSFGAFFPAVEIRGRKYFGAKIVPARGVWVEFESDPDGAVYVRIDRKRKLPATSLLRALGSTSDKDLTALFADHPTAYAMIQTTLAKDTAKTADDAYIEIYKRLRDGDLATVENAREFLKSIFSVERYDLSPVGRFKMNERFGRPTDTRSMAVRTLTLDDCATLIRHIAEKNATPGAMEDDIDHLGLRRVRTIGEMLQQRLRIGMTHMKRNIQNRMSTIETDATLPIQFINPRPLQARVKEFYTTNQLSQFMQQENILSEVEHLRTVSALGPGGLSRERAGYEVRDVHYSHYGRLCPIHTPEGPNIGLVLRLTPYARLNDFGMIETPYALVERGRVNEEIRYLNAHEEERFAIAHAATALDERGLIVDERVEVRRGGKPALVEREEVDFIEVATNQAYSLATSLIPFLNHDDANRALMGSNMQRQATPCVLPEAPLVSTGVEADIARSSGRVVVSESAGVVHYVDAKKILVRDAAEKDRWYPLVAFSRTNGMTVFHQRPVVSVGEKVKRGAVLADTSTSVGGELALGQNVLVAFVPWSGLNYEDAILLSEKLVRRSKFSSIHMEEFTSNVRDTKLGPEVTTHDIPNVSEAKLKNLDEEGIVRIGAEVRPDDILVGKITPKGETQLTPEERLLRSIFGEKARDVKDSSKRMDKGKRGRVVGVKVFSRERGDPLESGIIKRVHVEVAELRNISVGDKLAGRHGNKGVISRILPEEDMPFLPDGTPVDMILTPLGVPSRMNLGQIFELHLGLAAHALGYQAVVPPFAGATDAEIKAELARAGFETSGKTPLFDGRTGEKFGQPIAVGYMYVMKLHHMVEDKIHMRSIGPYSLITQQPLGGKAQGGGQRFGEMEVWALLGYGAAYTLREVLTVKSDDILGRSAAFESIVHGKNISVSNLPASFNVLLNNLRGLALDVELEKTAQSGAVL